MKFKKSQKFRVIINGVSFYTTAGQITEGVGDFTQINRVVSSALEMLGGPNGNAGIGTTIEGTQIQLSKI